MAVPSPLSSRRTVAALLTLTAVTGLVDAVSYLRLGRVFVANMTGNVVFLGFSADPRSGLSAAASVIAIAGFLLGALAGGRAAHALAARPGRWLASALTGEAVILGVAATLTGTGVLPFTGTGRFATIAVLAAALGVQNSTVRHLGAADLTTTVLTLTLTGLAADSTRAGGPGARPHRRLGSVAAMLAGAAAGAGVLQWSPVAVIAVAAALVAVVAGWFLTAEPATARPAPAAPVTARTAPAAPVTARTAPAAPVTARTAPAAPVTARTAPAAPVTARTAPAAPVTARTAPAAPVTARTAPAAPVTVRPAPAAPVTVRPAPAAPVTVRPAPAAPVTVRPVVSRAG